jgi:hypothetical protein
MSLRWTRCGVNAWSSSSRLGGPCTASRLVRSSVDSTYIPCCGYIVQLNDVHFVLPEISSKRSSCLRNHNIMTYSPQEILERTCEATLHPQQLTIPSGPHFRLTRDGLLITNQQCDACLA